MDSDHDTELYAESPTSTTRSSIPDDPFETDTLLISTVFSNDVRSHGQTNPVVYAVISGLVIAFLCACLFSLRIYCKHVYRRNDKNADNMGLETLYMFNPLYIIQILVCLCDECDPHIYRIVVYCTICSLLLLSVIAFIRFSVFRYLPYHFRNCYVFF